MRFIMNIKFLCIVLMLCVARTRPATFMFRGGNKAQTSIENPQYVLSGTRDPQYDYYVPNPNYRNPKI